MPWPEKLWLELASRAPGFVKASLLVLPANAPTMLAVPRERTESWPADVVVAGAPPGEKLGLRERNEGMSLVPTRDCESELTLEEVSPPEYEEE